MQKKDGGGGEKRILLDPPVFLRRCRNPPPPLSSRDPPWDFSSVCQDNRCVRKHHLPSRSPAESHRLRECRSFFCGASRFIQSIITFLSFDKKDTCPEWQMGGFSFSIVYLCGGRRRGANFCLLFCGIRDDRSLLPLRWVGVGGQRREEGYCTHALPNYQPPPPPLLTHPDKIPLLRSKMHPHSRQRVTKGQAGSLVLPFSSSYAVQHSIGSLGLKRGLTLASSSAKKALI